MNCEAVHGLIYDYLEGTLSADEQAAVEAHLAGCARCADLARETRLMLAQAGELLPEAPDFVTPAMRQIRKEERAGRLSSGRFWRRLAYGLTAACVLAFGSIMLIKGGFAPAQDAPTAQGAKYVQEEPPQAADPDTPQVNGEAATPYDSAEVPAPEAPEETEAPMDPANDSPAADAPADESAKGKGSDGSDDALGKSEAPRVQTALDRAEAEELGRALEAFCGVSWDENGFTASFAQAPQEEARDLLWAHGIAFSGEGTLRVDYLP